MTEPAANGWRFCDERGTFELIDPQASTYLYFPLVNERGLVSVVTPTLHGAGFVARLSGSSAEFLSIWQIMLMGPRPFFMRDGQLHLAFNPVLLGWLFTHEGTITFRFLGRCTVTYHNPSRRDTFGPEVQIHHIRLQTETGEGAELASKTIGPDYALLVRDGQITHIDVYWQENGS